MFRESRVRESQAPVQYSASETFFTVSEPKVHPGRRQGFFQLSPHVLSLCLRVWEGERTQREGVAVQVEPRVAVQWPITLNPAGGEDKGLPLGASPPGGLRISHQLGMVLVSQFSAEVGIYARIRVHPPKLLGGRFGFYLQVSMVSRSKASGRR